jgi:hypothetical protein
LASAIAQSAWFPPLPPPRKLKRKSRLNDVITD